MENNEKPLWFKVEDISKDLKNADAVLILTEWEEYGTINWNRAAEIMRKPAWVFDARSIINIDTIRSTNLNFWRIGDGSLS